MKLKNVESTALVLEGGGMRGIFTAGVLDYFMDNEMWFPYTIGVSARASNGISYMSRQRGRAKFGDVDLLKIRPYIGLKHFLKGHGYIDLDFIFYEYPEKHYPLDFKTYSESTDRFVMVTANCITGQAEYMEEKKDYKRMSDILKASCSLPFLAPIAYVDDIPMLDGGICDPLPIKKAMEEGYKDIVVVLTRNKGYRKNIRKREIPKFVYKQYPHLRDALFIRSKHYNETIEYIERLEEEGKIKVIRPVKKIMVGRTEKDPAKLNDFYKEGYDEAKRIMTGE